MLAIIKKFIPAFLLNWYHFGLAFSATVLYGFPSRKVKVIGITGTNGKTTIAELSSAILEAAGYKVAVLSSIKFKIGDKERENKLKMTMPGRFQVQKFLRQAADGKCQYVILEVTSEGIKQHRHRFIDFEAAVFANLTPEHIESHGGFENYKKAKGKLFAATKKIHIVNTDDKNADYFLQFPAKKKYTYGLNAGDVNKNNFPFRLQLTGGFNNYNALAAACVGFSQSISANICRQALEKYKGIPGRMEEVISAPFRVIVDYAFTPNALEQVYKTLKPNNPQSKLICVLGACGGGRDKWKRPVLGKIAGQYCDEIIITNEDPYDENPAEIINQVAEVSGSKAKKILDRREAVKEALKSAKAGDVVVITGKGCEPWICVAGGKKIAWDDRNVVKEEMMSLDKESQKV